MSYVQQGGSREELHRYLNSQTLSHIREVLSVLPSSIQTQDPRIPVLFFLNGFAQAHFNHLSTLPYEQMGIRLYTQVQAVITL